jgi:membrane protease YdiL (CAAX protease family)
MGINEFKKSLTTGKGIIIISLILSVLAFLESFLLPWAPYFFLYAIFALIIPLSLKTYRFGKFTKVFSSYWILIIFFWIALIFWDQLTSGSIAKIILTAISVEKDPYYSLPAFTEVILSTISSRMGISILTSEILFALFVVIWAPLGEELLYRGYIFGGLREKHGFFISALVSSVFFGLRHILPMFYLLPDLYWIPALNWGVLAFVFGMLSSFLYEKTGSLYPCMIGHVLVNIAGLLVM